MKNVHVNRFQDLVVCLILQLAVKNDVSDNTKLYILKQMSSYLCTRALQMLQLHCQFKTAT